MSEGIWVQPLLLNPVLSVSLETPDRTPAAHLEKARRHKVTTGPLQNSPEKQHGAALKELKIEYHNPETLLFAIYP